MDIRIVDLVAEPALAVKRPGVGMEGMIAVINQGYDVLLAKLDELGVCPCGPPYLCYTDMSPDMTVFDIELGLPVPEPLTVDGEFLATTTYGGRAVEAVHQGPYDSLETAYGAMLGFMGAQGLESTGAYYDIYLNDPDHTPAADLLTRIVFPVKP